MKLKILTLSTKDKSIVVRLQSCYYLSRTMGSGGTVLENFIVLEGLDGSGTTTQMEILSRRLTDEGANVLATCEPSRGHVGTFIRRILRQEIRVDPCTLAQLFAADRNEHLYGAVDGVISHLEAGGIVVCDRYLFSSLAYQSVGCSYERVLELNERYPLPEYLVFLDVPPEECQRRLSTRPGVELFEGKAIQNEIIGNYARGMEQVSASGMKVIRIDGSQPIDAVSENIWSALRSLPIQRV